MVCIPFFLGLSTDPATAFDQRVLQEFTDKIWAVYDGSLECKTEDFQKMFDAKKGDLVDDDFGHDLLPDLRLQIRVAQSTISRDMWFLHQGRPIDTAKESVLAKRRECLGTWRQLVDRETLNRMLKFAEPSTVWKVTLTIYPNRTDLPRQIIIHDEGGPDDVWFLDEKGQVMDLSLFARTTAREGRGRNRQEFWTWRLFAGNDAAFQEFSLPRTDSGEILRKGSARLWRYAYDPNFPWTLPYTLQK